MKTIFLAAVGAAAMITSTAGAQTYTSGYNGAASGGSYFTPTHTTAFGQFFTSTGGTLNALTFVDTDATSKGTQLVVQAFDVASKTAVGSVLYQGFGSVAGNGDMGQNDGTDTFNFHTFSNIGVSLTAGQSYVAYLVAAPGTDTFDGVPIYDNEDPDDPFVADSTNYSYYLGKNATALGGAFVFRNSDFASGGAFTTIADSTPGHDPLFQADYTINISPITSSVPEPATWAMMFVGFGFIGFAMRRRSKQTVRVNYA